MAISGLCKDYRPEQSKTIPRNIPGNSNSNDNRSNKGFIFLQSSDNEESHGKRIEAKGLQTFCPTGKESLGMMWKLGLYTGGYNLKYHIAFRRFFSIRFSIA